MLITMYLPKNVKDAINYKLGKNPEIDISLHLTGNQPNAILNLHLLSPEMKEK